MNKLLCLILILLVTSCSQDSNEPVTTTESGVRIIIPSGNERYLNLDSDYVFDQDKLLTYELILPDSNLAKIDSDPTAEQYVEGMLVHNGDTVSPVGIRYKGSIGAFVNCVSGPDWANPSGSKTCTKLSMKIKINWEGRKEKFYGLNKLQFHSQNLDDSQMRERLGYWLFREMRVPAPRSVHARLVINGVYSGLYALTEQIDGRFSRYNFNDGDGNLYKEVWPLTMDGQPQTDLSYLSALKTNEDEMPSVKLIRNFATEVSNAINEDLPLVIEKYLDVDEIISYCVVDRTIRHDDGPFHWYCNSGNCSSHNFYWYEEPSRNKLHLIAWDLDNAFENIIFNANPVTPIADPWGEVTNDCQPFSFGLFRLVQWSATCDKLTGGLVTFDDIYEYHKSRLFDGPMSSAMVTEQMDKWSEQIRSATVEAFDLHGDAVSVSQWDRAMDNLRQQVNVARTK